MLYHKKRSSIDPGNHSNHVWLPTSKVILKTILEHTTNSQVIEILIFKPSRRGYLIIPLFK